MKILFLLLSVIFISGCEKPSLYGCVEKFPKENLKKMA
jgi:hypothetical protein